MGSICRVFSNFTPPGLPQGLHIQRRQFPIILAYAITTTIHKSQGQTLDRVLFDVRDDFFTHGHHNFRYALKEKLDYTWESDGLFGNEDYKKYVKTDYTSIEEELHLLKEHLCITAEHMVADEDDFA